VTPEHWVARVGQLAREMGLDVYAVGGYVRDRLLGQPFAGDIDFSVVGNAPEFAERLAAELKSKRRVQIYRRFGTASLPLEGIDLEFASSRRESYSPGSRNPDVEPAPFEEDLARRDFTINALAVDTRKPDEVLDRFGGLNDLDNGIIRTPLDPVVTFSDDPLRILRAIRFAARFRFKLHPETRRALIEQHGRLKIVARERINDEFFKILSHNPPGPGLLLLHETGILKEVFPELAELAGVDQVGKHHHKDVLLHTIRVVDKVAEKTDDVSLRFAALVHDIGKPATKKFVKGTGWTFHGHEHVGERLVRKLGERYKWGDELTQNTARLVRMHMRPMNLQDEGVTDSAIRRLMVQAGQQIDDLLLLCRADITSGNEQKVRRYLREFDRMVTRMDEVQQRDELRAFQSPVRGDEIMERYSLPEGPRVGLIKVLIEEAILEGEIEFSREAALEYLPVAAARVESLEEKEVLSRLREIMRSRADGAAPPEPTHR
jgi:putative nucleotidyltransferase with HDIG domain